MSYYKTSPTTFNELILLAVDKINNKLEMSNHIVYLVWSGEYSDRVSCSHNAPKGKKTNWSGQENRPTHYPGWIGRVWVSTKKDFDGFNSNLMANTGISSGTGGYGLYYLPEWVDINPEYRTYNRATGNYGHYPMSWDSRIFELDFPLLSNVVHKQRVKETLTKKPSAIVSVKTQYVHPNYRQVGSESIISISEKIPAAL